jgi:hypothetical protein
MDLRELLTTNLFTARRIKDQQFYSSDGTRSGGGTLRHYRLSQRALYVGRNVYLSRMSV